MSLKSYGLPIERLFDGAPIIRPIGSRWESGVTFNSAAVYLQRSPINDPIICKLLATDELEGPALKDGVVALHYRARPKHDPGYPWNRSYVGLAVFTPTLQLLKRYAEPIIVPGARPTDPDYLGVEDPRITRIGDTFYAVYCGVTDFAEGSDWKAANCLASSQDLLNWQKYGPFRGDVNEASNKDGVLFPEPIDGNYFLLHRPMYREQSDHRINLAVSDAPDGIWRDCGVVMQARPDPDYCVTSWVGAGAVPIPLGERRYLVIFHTGNRLRNGDREYHLDAAIFNFNRFSLNRSDINRSDSLNRLDMNDLDCADPSALVEKRIDRIMVPETETELRAPFSDSVANVLFTCGAYEHDGDLYIIYGGGDTFILAARVPVQTLLDHLQRYGD